jgi:hypothetical protein
MGGISNFHALLSLCPLLLAEKYCDKNKLNNSAPSVLDNAPEHTKNTEYFEFSICANILHLSTTSLLQPINMGIDMT